MGRWKVSILQFASSWTDLSVDVLLPASTSESQSEAHCSKPHLSVLSAHGADAVTPVAVGAVASPIAMSASNIDMAIAESNFRSRSFLKFELLFLNFGGNFTLLQKPPRLLHILFSRIFQEFFYFGYPLTYRQAQPLKSRAWVMIPSTLPADVTPTT